MSELQISATRIYQVSAGQIWANVRRHRRILAVGNGRVLYSFGGDFNRECLGTTFARWIRRSKAKLIEQGGGCISRFRDLFAAVSAPGYGRTFMKFNQGRAAVNPLLLTVSGVPMRSAAQILPFVWASHPSRFSIWSYR